MKTTEKIKVNPYKPLADGFYAIHDNGDRPFVVKVIDDQSVIIYKIDEGEEEFEYNKLTDYEECLRFNQLEGIFIHDTDEYTGCNILLQVSDLECILISGSVVKFTTFAPICRFESPMGNNNVPYPVAYDEDDRCYLLWDNIVLESAPKGQDPTDYWIYHHRIQDSIKVGLHGLEHYFCMNVSRDEDKTEWDNILVRELEDKIDSRRSDLKYNEIIRRNDLGLLRPAVGSVIGIHHLELELEFEEWKEIEQMFEDVEIHVELEDKGIYVKDPLTKKWFLIDFSKYQELQDQWRARLPARHLEVLTVIPRRW